MKKRDSGSAVQRITGLVSRHHKGVSGVSGSPAAVRLNPGGNKNIHYIGIRLHRGPELFPGPRCSLLVGDRDAEPLRAPDCLDLVRRMLCTCSRTRCLPEGLRVPAGRASEVSSTFPMAMTDFRGSELVILYRKIKQNKYMWLFMKRRRAAAAATNRAIDASLRVLNNNI